MGKKAGMGAEDRRGVGGKNSQEGPGGTEDQQWRG